MGGSIQQPLQLWDEPSTGALLGGFKAKMNRTPSKNHDNCRKNLKKEHFLFNFSPRQLDTFGKLVFRNNDYVY